MLNYLSVDKKLNFHILFLQYLSSFLSSNPGNPWILKFGCFKAEIFKNKNRKFPICFIHYDLIYFVHKAIDKFYLDGEISLLDLNVGTGDDKYVCE